MTHEQFRNLIPGDLVWTIRGKETVPVMLVRMELGPKEPYADVKVVGDDDVMLKTVPPAGLIRKLTEEEKVGIALQL